MQRFYLLSLSALNRCPVLKRDNVFYTFYSTGKDQIIFVTKEDHEAPSSAELVEEDPNDPYEERGEKHWH